MKTHRVKQGTRDWYMLRLGKPTASCFDRIITPKTGKASAQQDWYLFDLLAERVMGCPPEDAEAYTNRAIEHGNEFEPMARAAYALEHDADVVEVGFCETDDGFAGCSPDGLVGDDGGLELKCPQLATHLRYLKDPAELVAAYRCQVHGCLWVAGRDWWDIASYAPWQGVPMVVERVRRDEFTDALGEALGEFQEKYEKAWA
ncbi:MAG: YqaJ viral recombinase family protein, partial [Phycisphaerales bacterium]|nr:YqaJ viral recombinase family protein [Phycisphaerales bacterium]